MLKVIMSFVLKCHVFIYVSMCVCGWVWKNLFNMTCVIDYVHSHLMRMCLKQLMHVHSIRECHLFRSSPMVCTYDSSLSLSRHHHCHYVMLIYIPLVLRLHLLAGLAGLVVVILKIILSLLMSLFGHRLVRIERIELHHSFDDSCMIIFLTSVCQ
jgi:hypothetical protein